MKTIRNTLFMVFFCTSMIKGGDFLKQFVKSDTNQKFFLGIVEEKQKSLHELKKEQDEMTVFAKTLNEKIVRQMNDITALLITTEKELQKNPDDDFLIKQQIILKETEQVLKDIQRTVEDNNSLLVEIILLLQSFIDDPYFELFKKKNKLNERLYYSFDDLQSLHDHILDYEQRITQLSDQEKSLRVEKEGRKRAMIILQEEYDKRQQDIKLFMEAVAINSTLMTNSESEKEIIKIEDHFYKYKKQLADLRLKEITYQIKLIENQLFLAKSYFDLFKKQLRIVKSAIHVSEADVTLAEEDLAKEQKLYFTHKDTLRNEREKIITIQKNKEKELNSLSKQIAIPLGSEIDEWSKKPKQTSNSYVDLVHIGTLNAEAIVYTKEKDLLDAHLAFEEEKFNYKKIKTEAKKTYHKILTQGFLTEEEIAKERTEYETKKKIAEENSKLYQTKINAVAVSLNQLKKIFDRINSFREDAEKQNELIFKNKAKEYNQFINYLIRADRALKKQIDILGKLTGVYSGIVSEISSTVRLIDFISTELQASTIWYRPAYAITLDGVKNIISDTKSFFNDIRIYIAKFNRKVFFINLYEGFSRPLTILFVVLILCIMITMLYYIKKYHVLFLDVLLTRGVSHGALIHMIGFILGTLITFFCLFSYHIVIWVGLWLFCAAIPDNYFFILFYLFSVPYLLYLFHRYIKMLMQMNGQYGYPLLSQDFQRRFELVFSILVYLTIIVFFFRQAFMLSPVHVRSELSNILLAIHFIILQISLIFLITKEQIMGIIPSYSDFWRRIHGHVDHYYYLILLFVVATIIMSNPYVGFGRLVLYLLSGSIYMIFLVKILSLLHNFVKKITSLLFFIQEDTIIRERFSYAKTCFGLVIIASFVILGFIGFIGTAKIWGFDVAITDFKKWLQVPLLLEGTIQPITTLSILKIIAFVLSGFIVAYALKQYVLARIFDLLLVESGVQHTVTSIIQYIVIIIATFFAFNGVGLGSLIGNVFIALALSIGLYIKDPISDFISYFIILVQRPIKIGDYVQIDADTMGIVRKITPRSVILRRKNSTTIIVPNSYVVSKSIENWNYVRNFIAINDITLFVYFKEDPYRIKSILHAAIEEHVNVLKNPRSIVRLTNFTEYGYEFMVRCFISSAYTLEMWDVASDIRLLIAKAFKENSIDFAIPMYKVDEFGHYFETKLSKENNTSLHHSTDGDKIRKE
ncbi:MAG TPA: mechanosensitive ion channel domain-containing protein [Candidatus Babeliales bacterium]|nr:mechanosensitive ion channel domain-containing protein [Candidatus Babeliales bacterium]